MFCGNALADIALQDGSVAVTTSTGSTTVSKTNFTVTPGASVLVVALVDRNGSSVNSGPATLDWNGGGSPETLTQVVSINGAGSTYAWANIYYLFNPTPGTATITATDASGATPSVMAIQAYTLSGVDTTVTPVAASINGNPVGTLTLTLDSATPMLGWAAVCSHYGTTTGNGFQLSANGGTLNFTRTSVTIQEAMGYVANLGPGSSTIIGRDTNGGTQKMALAAAVFAPHLPGPAAPTGLTATGQTNQVALSWTDGSGGAATGYVVWRNAGGGSFSPVGTNVGTANVTFTDKAVADWTAYNYSVQAVGAAGAGRFSDVANATPVGAPLAPTGVTVVGIGNSAVLNWNAPAGTTSYNLLRSTVSGSETLLQSGVTTTAYTNTGLTLNTTYYYVVQAVNDLGTSPNSAEVTVTPLSAPNAFVATGATNKVNLSWADTTGGKATGYLVLRSITSGGGANGYQTIATLAGNASTTFTDKTVYTGYTYYYVIEATSPNATSAASSQASAAPIWYMPAIAVPIAILDPISIGNFGAGATTVTMPFSVSAGAAALVFTLFDANNNDSGVFAGPDMVWSNITLGITQPITVAASANSHGYNYSWGSVWYLMNPLPGVGVLIGTESTGAHLAMFSQAYTLVGVDTSTTPEGLGDGAASAKTLSVSTSPNTVLNSWAQGIAVNYNGGGGNDVILGSSSGGVVQTNYRAWGAQTTFGYITNINPGAGTITATANASAGPTLMYLAEATFAPLVTLSPPTGVTATGENNQIALSWNSVSGATSYEVLRSTTSGSGYIVIRTNVGNASTTFTDTSVVNYTTYYYVVQAASAGGVSLYSAEVNAFATGLPGVLTVTAFGNVNRVDLNWAAQTSATSYNVYRSLTSVGGYSLVGSPATAGFSDTAVVDGTRYYYEVNAVNGNGTGPNSSPASAIPCVAFLTNYIGNFQSDADVTPWVTLSGAPVNSYAAGDTPNGPSAGALEMVATFGPGTTGELNGIAKLFSPNFNVSTYNTIELDMYNSGGFWDQYGQISAVQLNLQVPVTGTPTYERGTFADIQLSQTGGGGAWAHFAAPLANWNAYDLTHVSAFGINVLDFNFVSAATPVAIRYANIAFCQAPAWMPAFSVANRTAPSGSTSVVLAGKVSATVGGAPVYLWAGTPISVTINGSTQTTAIENATGDFTIAFNTTGFANGAYPVTYSAASDMVALVGVTNSGTSLTVGGAPPSRPTIQPAAVDATGANMVVKVTTQSGYLYYLLTTPSLTPPVVWTTNSITTGTGGTITDLVPITKSERGLFVRYLVQ